MRLASPAARRLRPAAAFVAAVGALGLMLLAGHARATPYADDVLLADAWRHGHAWIAVPSGGSDALAFRGRAYVTEAPLPAVLLLPVVAVAGSGFDQTLLANVLGALAVFAAWRLCRSVGLDVRITAAACAFFLFGTSLFACATDGNVWFLAHTSAAAFTLLALAELLGRRRAALVATWAAGAALSRYSLAGALPVYLALLLGRVPRRATLEAFLTPLAPAFAASCLYDYSRFTTLFDAAAWLRYRVDAGDGGPGPFAAAYAPARLAEQFLTPLRLGGAPPWLAAPALGFGVPYTGLPFAYAFAAGLGRLQLALWLAALLTALPGWFGYDGGGVQFASRFALDYEPFLFALLVLALRRRPSRAVAVALVVFATLGAYLGLWWLLVPGVRA